MAKGYRKGRLAEEIRKVISGMLLRDLTDPAFHNKMISVSGVEVTQDASYATVYLSILGKNIEDNAAKDEKDEVINAFNRAKTLIRKEINKNVKLHHIPDLIFKTDNSLEYGRHMSKIIDSLDIPDDEGESEHDITEEDTEYGETDS